MWRKLEILWRDFVIGCKNLITWIPLVWQLRPWDYSYNYQLLELQITQQRDYIQKNKRFIDWEYTVRDMNIALKLLKRIQSSYYELESSDYCEKSYEFVPIPDRPGFSRLEITKIKDDLDDFFKIYPRISKKYKDLTNGDRDSTALRTCIENHRRAVRLFHKILSEKLEGWWD